MSRFPRDQYPPKLYALDVPDEIVQALGGHPPTHQQWDAISAPVEPCVVIAGAGSGKTAVMAARIVWLILNGAARPAEILGLTFTNKAAENLLERVRRAIVPLGLGEGEEPHIATYHGFAASLIADHGLRAGLEPGAALMSEAQAWQLCADAFAGRTYDALQVRSLYHVASVRQLADECANHLVSPEQVIERDRAFLRKLDEEGRKAHKDVERASAQRAELAEVVATYRERKRERHLLDYGDQIAIACELAADPRVQEDVRARFRVALLDEYQDTNHAQGVMLRRLLPVGYPLMAVGDPDQNIYAWRGASLHNLLAFATQFPIDEAGREAHTRPLFVSFRSGARILALANRVIDAIPKIRRPPGKVLEAHPRNGDGEVAVFLAADQAAEAERIAAEARRAHDAGVPWGEMAVLARKKRLFGEVVETFRRHEIPVEVIGLGGLLRMPEVVDLVAVLRVLDDPLRNVALARLLRGPRWRIGYRDLALIARHASAKNKDLDGRLPYEYESPGDVKFSLAEALHDLDEIEGLSEEAVRRLRAFAAELAELRAHASLPLPELVALALDRLGLVRELDASPSPAASAAKRNLANFLDRVAAFQPLQGPATLSALIEWLDAFEESDEDIEAAQPSDADAVKVMTIHQAKGLEFDVVFVPGLAGTKGNARIFPDIARQPNPATSPRSLPFELRGDSDVLPRFMGNLSQFKDDLTMRAMEEERRLLYVAVTRARRRLVCSAAWWYEPSGMGEALKHPLGPSDFWHEIRAFEGVEVLEEIPEAPEPNPLIARRAERAAGWPPPARPEPDPLFPAGLAAAVEEARARVEPDETLFPAPRVEQADPLPRALPVSALVTFASCPKRFYWSYVRPLPRRSSSAARVGTIVHAWIEQRGRGQITLYDPEEFEERPASEGGRIAELKRAFESSRFATMTAIDHERPFALVVGDHVVRGRIDAVYPAGDGGCEIVDFKTGTPYASEDGPQRWQLYLYALAAQEIWGYPADRVTLTFAFLSDGRVVEQQVAPPPSDVMRKELGEMLGRMATGAFDAAPAPGSCRSCDFLTDCPPGRAAVGGSRA